MTRRLFLLRHAKSSWDGDVASDFDRPLSDRGVKDAQRLGLHFSRTTFRLDAIIASPAVRTTQTLQNIAVCWPQPIVPSYERTVYLADADRLYALMRKFYDGHERIMVVGHNPGLHELAIALADQGDAAELASLRDKLPTGTLVEIVFSVSRWRDIKPCSGLLCSYLRPKDIAP